MTTKLNVGQDFKLPLDVITMATAILGLRGSGKTNTAGVWTEELLKVGQQVIVIDPQNVWWGLKSSADGKQAGFPIVIFGGDHADVPITGTEGKQLADFVVENQVPCIFSLRHLSLNAQRKFVTALTEQIFYRKGEAKYQTPALVIIDEAHKFVPQKVQGDDMAMLVHRIQMLVTEGRASGIGVTLIDQRAATVNKDVLTQIELMVVHRTVGPQDKKPSTNGSAITPKKDRPRSSKSRSRSSVPVRRGSGPSAGWTYSKRSRFACARHSTRVARRGRARKGSLRRIWQR
jgi:DNA helicase HerA-like ATPase